MHKKIAQKCSKSLMEDSEEYEMKAKKAKTPVKKKHAIVEKKEAVSAARDLKKRAQKMHEY